jgi:predicted metalloendopeptidase
MPRSLLLCASALLVSGLSGAAFAADTKPEIGSFGFDIAGMDRSVRPGDDFVAFAGGNYLKALEIPADRSNYGMFTRLTELSQTRTRGIVEAAILQAPFFDAAADPAVNYGGIGAVIGHEISHSFDSLGAEFDAEGRLRNWWTAEDKARFNAQAEALVKQYDAYEALPGLFVNGRQTLGENIADVAGLVAAFDAWQASLGGKPAPVIDGKTGEQRFFIAFAQAWRAKQRDKALRSQIATDGHAPARQRAQTVRNVDGWYDAFGVKPGDKLHLPPEKRVKVW